MNPTIRTTSLALALPAVAAAGYIWLSCERFATGPGQCSAQWAQGGAMVMSAAGWVMGYWQPNPVIRERERELLMVPPPSIAGPAPEPPKPEPFVLATVDPIVQGGRGVERWTAAELDAMRVAELQALAREAGHSGLTRKNDLVRALTDLPKV